MFVLFVFQYLIIYDDCRNVLSIRVDSRRRNTVSIIVMNFINKLFANFTGNLLYIYRLKVFINQQVNKLNSATILNNLTENKVVFVLELVSQLQKCGNVFFYEKRGMDMIKILQLASFAIHWLSTLTMSFGHPK